MLKVGCKRLIGRLGSETGISGAIWVIKAVWGWTQLAQFYRSMKETESEKALVETALYKIWKNDESWKNESFYPLSYLLYAYYWSQFLITDSILTFDKSPTWMWVLHVWPTLIVSVWRWWGWGHHERNLKRTKEPKNSRVNDFQKSFDRRVFENCKKRVYEKLQTQAIGET